MAADSGGSPPATERQSSTSLQPLSSNAFPVFPLCSPVSSVVKRIYSRSLSFQSLVLTPCGLCAKPHPGPASCVRAAGASLVSNTQRNQGTHMATTSSFFHNAAPPPPHQLPPPPPPASTTRHPHPHTPDVANRSVAHCRRHQSFSGFHASMCCHTQLPYR